MSENKNNSFLTATYQNIFIMDLRQINECYFNRDYKGAYEALKILLNDKGILFTVLLWIAMVGYIIY